MPGFKKFKEAVNDYPYPYPYPCPKDEKNPTGCPKVAIDSAAEKPIRFKMDKDKSYPYPYPKMPEVSKEPVITMISICSKADSCPIMGMDDLPDNFLEIAESCKTAIEQGCPLFLKCFSEQEGIDIGWQEIFEMDDDKTLNIIMDNFRNLKNLTPPIVLGHDENQTLLQNSGYPSAGWITDLKRREASNVLLAKFSCVPPVLVKLIESKAYSRISAELYVDYVDSHGKHYGPTLRRISILGADIPYIKTLDDLCVIYNSENSLPIKTLFMEDHMTKEEIEEQKKKDSIIIKLQEDAVKAQDLVKLTEQKLLTLSEQLTTTNQKLALATASLMSTQKDRILNDLNVTFTPAVVEEVTKILTFAEDDPALKVIKLFETHLRNGSLVKPDIKKPILPVEDPVPPAQGDPIAVLHKKILVFAETAKIPYEDAYNKMSSQGLIKI